jgi:Leucine-rich repeat (LRR) protein
VSLDVSNLPNLVFLLVQNNELKSISLQSNHNLKELSIRANAIEDLGVLPASLERLWVDRKAILKYDFGGLMFLKELKVFSGHTKRDELTNLGKQVRFKYFFY